MVESDADQRHWEETRAKEEERLRAFPYVEAEPNDGVSGVLLASAIRAYVAAFKLIDPFIETQLKPARYELTVGDEYYLDGIRGVLGPNEQLAIPSFSVAILTTAETLNLPAFLIARWNIRVKCAYQGLLWVGGQQVDPGWVGRLCCPIYNLSNETVSLTRGEPIASIDFVRTSHVSKPERYPRPPKRVMLRDYERLQSAYSVQVRDRLEKVERSSNDMKRDLEVNSERLRARVDTFIGVVFTVMALLIAVFAIRPQNGVVVPSYGLLISLGLSLSAALFSFFLVASDRERGPRNALPRYIVFAIAIALSGAAIWFTTWSDRRTLESRIGEIEVSIEKLERAVPNVDGTKGAVPPIVTRSDSTASVR